MSNSVTRDYGGSGDDGSASDDPVINQALLLRDQGVSIEELLRRFPQHADRLRRLFADERSLGFAGPPADPVGQARYRIGELIGEGGMGEVYRAEDLVLRRTVAMKVLRQRHATPESFKRYADQLRLEAVIGARLTHPGIVPLHDVGQMDDGRPFLIMKLVVGTNLKEILKERKHPLDWHLDVFGRICEAVAAAHGAKPRVIHRDLKPANVMVSERGDEVYTMDWGLAKQPADPGAVTEDPTASIGGGTPAYSAPEQARGEKSKLGPATDVFALGLILYEILAGERFYGPRGQSLAEIRRLSKGPGLADLDQRLAACPGDPELKALVRACLQEDAALRPADAGALLMRFQAYRQGVRAALERERIERARDESRRRWQLLTAGVILFAILVGFGVWRAIEIGARERRDVASARGNAFLSQFAAVRSELTQMTGADDLGRRQTRLNQAKIAYDGAVVGAEIDDSLRAELVLVGQEIDESLKQAVRQERLMSKIHEGSGLVGSRIDGFEIDNSSVIAVFRGGYAEYGIVPGEQAPEEVARLLDTMPKGPREEALTGLDLWALIDRASAPKIRAAVDHADDDSWRRELRKAFADKDIARLKDLAGEVAARKPSVNAICLLAIALRRGQRADDSVALLREAAFVHPREFWIHLELARSLARTYPAPAEEVVACCRTAVALKEDNALAWKELAYHLGMSGHFAEAERCLDRAFQLAPENPHLRLSRFVVLNQRNAPNALADLKALQRENPDRADVAALLSRNVFASNLPEAKQLLDHAKRIDKDCPQIPFSEAMVAIAEGRYEDYLAVIQKLRRIDPGEQNLIRTECLGLLTVGNYEDAEILARKSLAGGQLSVAYASTYNELNGFSLLLQGRPKEAEPWAREAYRLQWTFEGNQGRRAGKILFQVLLQQGKFEEAIPLRPKANTDGPFGTVLGAAVEAMYDSVLRMGAPTRDRIADLKFEASDRGSTLAAEVGLASDMPRHVFPFAKDLLGQRKSGLFGSLRTTPTPIYINEFYPLNFRISGARIGVRSGCDPMREPVRLLDPAQLKLARDLSLEWLAEEVDDLARRAPKKGEKTKVNGILCFLQHTPDLAAVREPALRAKLPEGEREPWERLWKRIDDLRETVRWRPRVEAAKQKA
jgi:tetratricopeptide (TPR) repeat protein